MSDTYCLLSTKHCTALKQATHWNALFIIQISPLIFSKTPPTRDIAPSEKLYRQHAMPRKRVSRLMRLQYLVIVVNKQLNKWNGSSQIVLDNRHNGSNMLGKRALACVAYYQFIINHVLIGNLTNKFPSDVQDRIWRVICQWLGTTIRSVGLIEG